MDRRMDRHMDVQKHMGKNYIVTQLLKAKYYVPEKAGDNNEINHLKVMD